MKSVSSYFVALTVMLVSCVGSKNTRFFLPEAALAPEKKPAGDGVVLGLRSVEMPEYLKNDYMPEMEHGHELKRDEFSRWAAPFPSVFEGQLVASLSEHGIEHPIVEPWPSFLSPQCSLWVRVNRWTVAGPTAQVDITWALAYTDRARPPKFYSFHFNERREAAAASSHADIVTQVAGRLGSEMAGEVKTQNECQAQYVDKK